MGNEYSLTMDHLRGHPVGVAYDGVPFSPVDLAELGQCPFHRPFQRGSPALIPRFCHQPSQSKICHHHGLVLYM